MRFTVNGITLTALAVNLALEIYSILKFTLRQQQF